jgi:type I restriction enzyme S subunit
VIADLKPYPEYKESGIAWARSLPATWRTERAKWLFTKMARPVRPEDEVVTCFRDGMVTLRKNRRLRGFTEATVEYGYQGIRKGDLVIHGMDAFAGAIGVSDSDGKGTPVYNVCQSNPGVIARYYAHAVREMSQSQWILALAKGIRERSTDFRYEMFGNQRVPLPPPVEQAAIVRFLDWANGRLERAIRAKRKVIALLTEQKQAIIHRAVTRGLDPSVPLKPSGISWLGDIPQHWEVRKIKSLVATVGGMTPNKGVQQYWIGRTPWVSPKDMKVQEIFDSKDHISDAALNETNICLIKPPAVLIVVRGMILARTFPTAVTRVQVTVNQDLKALLPRPELSADYFASLLTGIQRELLQLVEIAGHGTCCMRTDSWGNFYLPIPPLGEQQAICRFIQEKTGSLNTAISRLEREIELLREYRTRLVADVVTGKLDVREAAARLPEEAGEVDLSDLSDESDLSDVSDGAGEPLPEDEP